MNEVPMNDWCNSLCRDKGAEPQNIDRFVIVADHLEDGTWDMDILLVSGATLISEAKDA